MITDWQLQQWRTELTRFRINPGNIGSVEEVKAVVDVAKERNIPIRVGVNSGSLEKHILEKYAKSYSRGNS